MEIVVKTIFGSRLYGTDLPGSDIDYKVIYKSSLEDIILGRSAEIIRETGEGVPVETEYIELRKFLRDLANGQTYAIDMVFTPSSQIIRKSIIWDEIRESRQKFLSKDCKAFIGYCVTQAKVYSVKGRDIKLLHHLLELTEGLNPRSTLASSESLLQDLNIKVVTKSFKRNLAFISQDFIEVIGKYYSLDITVREFRKRLEEKLNSYGARARKASTSLKDWKAIYHAFRCIWELKELAQTGGIKFPLKFAPTLLEIRQGKWFDYKPERLEWEMASALADVKYSKLQGEVDREWLDNFILSFYKN